MPLSEDDKRWIQALLDERLSRLDLGKILNAKHPAAVSLGRLGGLKKVPKGTSVLSEEERKKRAESSGCALGQEEGEEVNQDEQDRELGRRVRELLQPDVEWVVARWDREPWRALFLLYERLTADIERWRTRSAELRAQIDQPTVAIGMEGPATGPTGVKIFRRGFNGALETSVSRNDDCLLVRTGENLQGPGVKETKLVPIVNERGEFRFSYGEFQELEIWQASRLILEPLLFG